MASTPRPYLWQTCELRADEADDTAGLAHYYTEEAQTFYLHDGLATKLLEVEEGHWQDATAGAEEVITSDEYRQLSWHHPSTGALFGSALLNDTLYLLRYVYAKDIGNLIKRASYSMQVDNPITQLNVDIMNYNSDAFIKPTTLFVPGAEMDLGLTMGDSRVYGLGKLYIDDVSFKYASPSVSVSSRNQIGVILNDETINEEGKKTDTVANLCKWVLDSFGITNYIIETNTTNMTIEYQASATGMRLLQDICDKASGFTDGTDWQIEETYDGVIIIGFNSFRANYIPKSVFKFDGWSELFLRSNRKAIDGAYSKVYVTGKDSNNRDLTPVIEDISTWNYWSVGANKTYFAPTMENTTAAEMARYAKVLAKQLKKTGVNETYNTSIKPQLLVGDYATVVEDGDETDIGIITQVTHNFSENGYTTDFVADSGGNKQMILSRAANSDEKVYTSSRRNNGDNRKKRLMDFIRNTATQVVRTTGGGGGGSPVTGVQDVLVDGESVVEDNVANITMPAIPVTDVEVDGFSVLNDGVAEIDLSGKQNTLIPGDRITISSDTISADIAPFSITNGKMCITYKGEVT